VPTDIPFACTCGTLRGHLSGIVPDDTRTGSRALCHCHSCRSAELHLGQSDPRPGGVDLYQTTPDRITIDTGTDALAAFSFQGSKLIRWYAGCCRAPLFITIDRPGFPFSTVRVARIADPDALGPVVAEAFVDAGKGKQKHVNTRRFIWGMIRRTLPARLSGRWKRTPFFDIAGAPVVQVHTLTDDETAALPLRG